jgi:hypothetical protein
MKIIKPNRIIRSYTQHLVAKLSTVFPLLCPVREADWIDGWDPISVFTYSGAAELGCVFTTASNPSNDIWYITRHEPSNGFIEMLKVTPMITVCKLTIQLQPTDKGSDAIITYSYTSLGHEGDVFIESFTEEYYRKFMQTWESCINHYLVHGKALRVTGA